VARTDANDAGVPLSELAPEVKAGRAGSFGEVASAYERFRPGPPAEAVSWILPERVPRVVDLGAGTGALTRLVVDRADEVVAVEPDERMRSVLTSSVPGALAVEGRGESIPLPDGCADAVLASSSWHWMDPVPTLGEVGRVLVPGGTLAALWSGPDPEGAFFVQAQALLTERARENPEPTAGDGPGPDGRFTEAILSDALRPASTLRIPEGLPFDPPEYHLFRWDAALDADEIIGLLGTLSWIITMPEETRRSVTDEARRLLAELLGVEGEVTVDISFRSDVWRSRRHG
jgi:SAM-dependent methyltransferase